MLGVAQSVDGRYTIQHRIGVGGMAEVYLATDESLGRDVALKILSPSLAADPSFVERFRREARAAAALNHPNVVAIYNWGKYDDTYFIVMEYVPGENLKERLRHTGPLPERDALAIAADVADALEAAHRQGLVHRDVKPHNILLAPDGRVKVTDFGIVRAAGSAQLTATNTVLGTAHYLSPEQVNHLPQDGRSDVYSLGIVLFEMLTNTLPFAGDTLVAVALKQVNENAPPVRSLRPELSSRTEAIVRTALAKDPAARFRTAAAMRDALLEARSALLGPAVSWTMPLPAAGTNPAPAPVPAQVAVAAPPTRPLPPGKLTPPPFLPPARHRTGLDVPLIAIGVLLVLFALGILLGTHLFRTNSGSPIATATPPGATQVAVGASLPTATALPRATTAVPAAATAPPAMPTATVPVVGGTALLPTAVPATATPAPTAIPPTAVPPTAVPATAVPPTMAPAPSATPVPPTMMPTMPAPPTATAVPPTMVAPTMVAPAAVAADNSTPIGAVRGFYQLVSAHQFSDAASLWSARQQQQFPPGANINGRFNNTQSISLDSARIVSQTADQATVAVTLTEVVQGDPIPHHYVGSWQLVHGPSGWLLDQPNLQAG